MKRKRTMTAPDGVGGVVDGLSPEEALAGDVIFCKPDGRSLVIRRDESDWKTEETPIGIVVIPASHGVLKDAEGNNCCGVMAVNQPSINGYNTPVYWGEEANISSLTSYARVVATDSLTSNTATKIAVGAYIPYQRNVGEDAELRSNYTPAPSPYVGKGFNTGGFNSSYSTKEFDKGGDINNSLADFNGKNNTNEIIKVRGVKNYKIWTPTNDQKDYPAVSICDVYKTEGTNQGEWYLPAMGELGYISPKYADLNNVIQKINNKYKKGTPINSSGYWSSSQSEASAMFLNAGGLVNYGGKESYTYYTLPFIRLSIKDFIKPRKIYGAYIEDIEGKLYSVSHYKEAIKTQSIVCNSVVILDSLLNVRLAIDKNVYTSIAPESLDISKIMSYKNYLGKNLTTQLLSLIPGKNNAVYECANYVFPDGKTQGFMPSISELSIVGEYLTEVTECLDTIGGESLNPLVTSDSSGYMLYNYVSCTPYSTIQTGDNKYLTLFAYNNMIGNISTSYVPQHYGNNYYYTRPISEYKDSDIK